MADRLTQLQDCLDDVRSLPDLLKRETDAAVASNTDVRITAICPDPAAMGNDPRPARYEPSLLGELYEYKV